MKMWWSDKTGAAKLLAISATGLLVGMGLCGAGAGLAGAGQALSAHFDAAAGVLLVAGAISFWGSVLGVMVGVVWMIGRALFRSEP